ncbi:MAG: dihydroorotate dehydrogenase electron transfer subunit [Thermodesulfobacteriota bacterium]
MIRQTDGVVIKNHPINSTYFLLEFESPKIANEAKPGQFIMLKPSPFSYPLLRRPFSLSRFYPTHHPKKSLRGHLFILYKKVGLGTEMMTHFQKGQKVNLIGPLGNGYTLPPLPSSSDVILVGGGIGVASLLSLKDALKRQKTFVFIGGKTKEDILCEKEFHEGGHSEIFIATEDGSYGERGTVVNLFTSKIHQFSSEKPFYLYTCGPSEMLKELSKRLKDKKSFIQASLESRMGCGIGACWGCVVKTIDPRNPYQRVCKEGPVFNLKEIDWEEL